MKIRKKAETKKSVLRVPPEGLGQAKNGFGGVRIFYDQELIRGYERQILGVGII